MSDAPPKKSRKGIGGRPKGSEYTEKIQVRLKPTEKKALESLCDYHGADASELIRGWIHTASAVMEKEKSD